MGPKLENYTIQREIGTGGMAIVYQAIDNRLHRTVAIKVLHPHLCKEPTASDRFIREARAAAKIDHPNVVRIYDYSSVENLHYIVMEFVPGTTMERVLKDRGPVAPDNGDGHHVSDCRSACAGTCAGNHSPGHQTGEYTSA